MPGKSQRERFILSVEPADKFPHGRDAPQNGLVALLDLVAFVFEGKVAVLVETRPFAFVVVVVLVVIGLFFVVV